MTTNETTNDTPAVDPSGTVRIPAAAVLGIAQAQPDEPADAPALEQASGDVVLAEQSAAPADFSFPYGPGQELSPEDQAQDGQFRQWLSDAGFSKEIGTSVAQAVDEFYSTVADFSDEQHQLQMAESRSRLEQLWGAKFDKNLRSARAMVAELDARHGGAVSAWLDETGVGNSVDLVVQLHHLAQRRGLK